MGYILPITQTSYQQYQNRTIELDKTYNGVKMVTKTEKIKSFPKKLEEHKKKKRRPTTNKNFSLELPHQKATVKFPKSSDSLKGQKSIIDVKM
ncbi:hypothetical protein [Mangrovibacillus cuniculi]|uniref:Uncharacterized protein n=1 Tax=Mangrovibacillus cuniculi TaxID=2593652 RepID=A0A7S8HET9_9BACI|nr:hypothetical protein [Mangrovibacillus cuniculi]QPC46103.1 hypothetical protein G8O30_03575 [Mangrovibacillus cuniculi]